jgi:hypothetical protein
LVASGREEAAGTSFFFRPIVVPHRFADHVEA